MAHTKVDTCIINHRPSIFHFAWKSVLLLARDDNNDVEFAPLSRLLYCRRTAISIIVPRNVIFRVHAFGARFINFEIAIRSREGSPGRADVATSRPELGAAAPRDKPRIMMVPV